MENDPDYGKIRGYEYYSNNYLHNYDYIHIKCFENPSARRWIHSENNSDYSFWSLDDTAGVDSYSDTEYEYCGLLRI